MASTQEQHNERFLEALEGKLPDVRVLYSQDILSAYSVRVDKGFDVFARGLNGHWEEVTAASIPLPVTAPREFTTINPVMQARQDMVRQTAAILRGWGHPAPFEEIVAGVEEVFQILVESKISPRIDITALLHRYRHQHRM
jgi:hypothetical protein